MKICFIPIDNRPVCYNLVKDIAAIDEDIEIFIPPREFLGDLKKNAQVNEILQWMESLPDCDAMILSLDTIAYGGLIPSRRSPDSLEEIQKRLYRLKSLIIGKNVYAFSSIMRIPDNNCNEEEKEYWKDWGKKIFEYSYLGVNTGVPQEILEDYLAGRRRNFEINKLYLNWKQECIFDNLIFSKDDCAPKGFNVDEAIELERLGGKTKTGADEIPLSLLARAIEKDIKIYVEYTEPDYKDSVSNYEDISIEKSVTGQLELGGFGITDDKNKADLILVVNNFAEKQGELVMGWETSKKYSGNFELPSKPYAIADVRYANGADNDFVEHILTQIDLDNFYGYAGWNTSANTLGSLLAVVKVKWKAKKYNDRAFLKLETIRFLDDWAYQANVRARIEKPCDISDLMKLYEDKLSKIFSNQPAKTCSHPEYIFPWERKFEIEIAEK